MKKIKLFLSIAIFACMTVGGYSAYDTMTMSDAETLMLANVEALTSDSESTAPKSDCVTEYTKISSVDPKDSTYTNKLVCIDNNQTKCVTRWLLSPSGSDKCRAK